MDFCFENESHLSSLLQIRLINYFDFAYYFKVFSMTYLRATEFEVETTTQKYVPQIPNPLFNSKKSNLISKVPLKSKKFHSNSKSLN